ncbi:amidase [Mycolicibacterium austroafricanum]|uniref:amidase n=1 Tax=Mycolicibacterium austroafricanum TaxID=39687 RepID=UPI001CA34F80|nr:amidase [Mycolicibacterium austroafricanum]QZT64260.1 amidase [Mycolicibacterium austroafricanum]
MASSADDVRDTGILGALARAQERGEVTAVELTQMSLDRVEAASHLNAVIRMDGERALGAAADIDRRRRRGEHLGALAGIPALVKDNMDVRGLPTTHGSRLCALDPPATDDDAAVARLRAAGAVIVGKTNLSEFAMEAISDNLVFGATHNPWRGGFSPGGSSGGSAAALASGLAPVATGTDGGGSVRIPASLCGLLGLKPTSGVTGARPARLPIELSSAGPMSSTVADLRILAELTLGPADGDPSCVYGPDRAGITRPVGTVFATSRVAGARPVDEAVESVFATAVEAFGRAVGREVRWLPPGVLGEGADEVWAAIYAPEDVFAVGSRRLREQYAMLDPRVREWVDRGLNSTLDGYLSARDARNEYVRRLDEMLDGANILLTPTVTAGPYPAGGAADAGELMPIDLFNTAALNLTGHPALTVPAGTVDAVPFGLQLVGPRGSDLWLIELAGAWERHQPWPLTAPGYDAFVPAAPSTQARTFAPRSATA